MKNTDKLFGTANVTRRGPVDLKEIVESLCPDVDRQLIREFFTRMDEDYFATFSPDEIAAHVRMAARLDPEHRINVLILPRRHATRSEFDIVIVGFDYMSEFSMFCGLLSSFGLDIHEGDIYSFSRSDAGAPPRKIVDVFHVSLKAGEKFDDTRQREFEQELQVLAGFLAAGALDKARERLNRSVTERVEEMNEQLTGLLSPIEIQFDNHRSPSWTVMEVHSANAFGFLYAVSNALAMQGIYIHKVKIRSSSGTVEDQFFMSDYWGRKIEDGPQQDRLRMAVVMIKQFTRFLPEAPDPAKAMLHFDQFLDKLAQEQFPDHIISFFAGEQGMSLLAHLLGSSDFLWDDFLGIHFKDLLPVLEDLTRTELQPGPTYKNYLRRQLRTLVGRGSSFLEKKKALNTFKEDQLFFIDSKHLLDSRVTLTVFSQALTEVAEVVLDEAVEMCLGHLGPGVPGAFTICGLGKFGGQEMGYASDLELLFVHESEAGRADAFFDSLAHAIVDLIQARRGGIFDIDLRLRPYGDAGAWSVPFQEFRKYYSPAGSAAAFERLATPSRTAALP
jgi:glutamate-ammonia-ligase adenylyltransferase